LAFPSQWEDLLGFGSWLLALGGLALMVREATGALAVGLAGHHSIPPQDLRRIAERYGWWAARRAEAACPHNDVPCVEREAKRLYEVYVTRRR